MTSDTIPTVEELKRLFPNPIRGEDRKGYCVGGALCLYLGREPSFPEWTQLAEVLEGLGVDRQAAVIAALEIIDRNEEEDFEKAWKIQGWALDLARKRSGPSRRHIRRRKVMSAKTKTRLVACPNCGSQRIEHHEEVVARRSLHEVIPPGSGSELCPEHECASGGVIDSQGDDVDCRTCKGSGEVRNRRTILVFEGQSRGFDDDGSNPRLRCRDCGYEWKIPEALVIDFTS